MGFPNFGLFIETKDSLNVVNLVRRPENVFICFFMLVCIIIIESITSNLQSESFYRMQ